MSIGIAYKQCARRVLHLFYGGDETAIKRILDDGYGSTEVIVEQEAGILAALSALADELYTAYGISIPMRVREAVLHSGADDPLIVKMNGVIKKLELSEDKKAKIAYTMMEAISLQHQENNSYEFLKKFTYETPTPNPEDIRKYLFHPLDDLRFVPLELAGWNLVENEYYTVAQAILSLFGIAPLHSGVEELYKKKQRDYVQSHKLQSMPALVECIKENRMSMVNAVDTILRHGSYPYRLAEKIKSASPNLFKTVPLNDTSWEQLEIVE